ncbi:MAG: Ig-like domain-containing protein [Burkholderiales bacterium]|nr:Ig-like domain-containing protein [Burkholderiales bacterium]
MFIKESQPEIKVAFTTDIDPFTVNESSFYLTSDSGAIVTTNLRFYSQANVIGLKPSSSLKKGAEYTINLRKNLIGNPAGVIDKTANNNVIGKFSIANYTDDVSFLINSNNYPEFIRNQESRVDLANNPNNSIVASTPVADINSNQRFTFSDSGNGKVKIINGPNKLVYKTDSPSSRLSMVDKNLIDKNSLDEWYLNFNTDDYTYTFVLADRESLVLNLNNRAAPVMSSLKNYTLSQNGRSNRWIIGPRMSNSSSGFQISTTITTTYIWAKFPNGTIITQEPTFLIKVKWPHYFTIQFATSNSEDYILINQKYLYPCGDKYHICTEPNTTNAQMRIIYSPKGIMILTLKGINESRDKFGCIAHNHTINLKEAFNLDYEQSCDYTSPRQIFEIKPATP